LKNLQHHCYEEIPPLQTVPTTEQRRPSTAASSDNQRILSTTTFESAPEFLSDGVPYEEVNIVKHETLLQTPPRKLDQKPNNSNNNNSNNNNINNNNSSNNNNNSSSNNNKNNNNNSRRSSTPPQRPPPPKFEKRRSCPQQTRNTNSEKPSKKTDNTKGCGETDIKVPSIRQPCIEEIIVPVLTESLLESVPRLPMSPSRPQPPERTNHTPPRDDSQLEPSLCNPETSSCSNISKELSKDGTSLYNVTKISGNLQTSPEGGEMSDISDVSSSFINLDASELTHHGDSTFEAKIELNQSTIDYIGTNTTPVLNAPTLDYISPRDVPPLPSPRQVKFFFFLKCFWERVGF
jgi:hypothetical protein